MLCKIAIIYYASKPGKHWLCKADNGNAVETLSGISGVHRADKEFPCNALIVIEAAVGFLHSKTVWGWQKVYKNFPLQCWAICCLHAVTALLSFRGFESPNTEPASSSTDSNEYLISNIKYQMSKYLIPFLIHFTVVERTVYFLIQ